MGKLVFLFVIASLSPAAELVKLHNGQVLRVDRADRDAGQVFLTVGSDVTILDAAEIASIQPEPDPNQPKPPEPVVDKTNPKELVRATAKAYGLPPEVVESVAATESAFRTNAVSHKGAIGVMQLMPGTARELGVNPHDVEENIEGGTRLLRQLLIKYDGDLVKALAAYNAGPGAVARYGGLPPYRETQRYVKKILNRLDALEAAK
ncbi:MAG: lytic transglycosylase domain-containing protein [Bryobacter sp.]|nr:lytic transglycosylase domain-containing protein [Bryobacter sp.]